MNELRCIVDCNKVAQHIKALGKPVILMAKAQCYGLGLSVIAYVDKLVAAYGVAYEQEGAELRELTKKPILLTTPVWTAEYVEKYALTPCVQSIEDVERLNQVNMPCAVHVKLNTGMNRFGINTANELRLLLSAIERNPNLYVAGVYTHYASDVDYVRQNKRLLPLLSMLPKDVCVHTQASSTAMEKGYDLLRIGMAAYADSARVLSTVIALRRVRAGECVGYDGIYRSQKEQYIAVIAGGYADGLPKSLRGFRVRIRGKLYPIAAVCMDVCMVAMDRRCETGDEVVVVGESVLPKDVSLYEMYTGLHGRCKFEYKGEA